MKIEKNKEYNNVKPLVTVITPVFNRRKEIQRAIQSVQNQTYKNFEYIIVNDGSKENLDDVVSDFMNNTSLAVMYIKKDNGGVHTARNAGFRNARGIYTMWIDSDDELTENAIKTFVEAWEKINEKDNYAFVRARVKNQNSQSLCPPFTADANSKSGTEKFSQLVSTEYVDMFRTKVLLENLLPEPKDVTLVAEGILFRKLLEKYDFFLISDELRIYHTETEISYCNGYKGKKTIQTCRNIFWNDWYGLTTRKSGRIAKTIIRYIVYYHILKKHDSTFVHNHRYKNIFTFLCYIPCLFIAKYIAKDIIV